MRIVEFVIKHVPGTTQMVGTSNAAIGNSYGVVAHAPAGATAKGAIEKFRYIPGNGSPGQSTGVGTQSLQDLFLQNRVLLNACQLDPLQVAKFLAEFFPVVYCAGTDIWFQRVDLTGAKIAPTKVTLQLTATKECNISLL